MKLALARLLNEAGCNIIYPLTRIISFSLSAYSVADDLKQEERFYRLHKGQSKRSNRLQPYISHFIY